MAANIERLTHQRTIHVGAMLEPMDLQRRCPLDNGLHDDLQVTPQKSSFSLGSLDTLPIELLCAILLDLDLQSLTRLRSVNCRARFTVDTLPQYNNIITHAPSSIRAALSINMSPWISCRQLHKELCSQECAGCGSFGAFLYLLSCQRICYICLLEETRFLPLTPANARIEFGLNHHELSKLPIALSLPGRYSEWTKIRRARIALVDRESARQAGIAIHHSSAQMKEYVGSSPFFPSLTSNNCMRARYTLQLKAGRAAKYEARLLRRDFGSRKPSCPPYTNLFDGKGANPYRFMCVVGFPWLDRCSGKVERGLSCRGCRDKFDFETEGQLDWRRLYTANGYLQHIKKCDKSIEILTLLLGKANTSASFVDIERLVYSVLHR